MGKIRKKRMPAPPREHPRYSVRVRVNGNTEEVGIGRDPDAAVQFAKLHHDQYGHRIWVWNVRTGAIIFERAARDPRAVAAAAVAAGGAA